MNSGCKRIVGETAWAKMTETFREWVNTDHFYSHHGSGHPEAGPPIKSVRELVVLVTQDSPLAPMYRNSGAQLNLDASLDSFLSSRISLPDSRKIEVGQIAYSGLCFAHVSALLAEASSRSPDKEGEAYFASMLKEAGVKSWEELSARVMVGPTTAILAHGLFDILREEIGSRSLRSFFIHKPQEGGYLSWWHGSASGCGEPLPTHSIQTQSGVCTVAVSSYKEMLDDNSVCAYEWNAHLRVAPESELPDAIATGMVYKLKREEGVLLSSASALRWASDAVSDTDVSQVLAFLSQVEDAEDRMEEGDLCFLWLWERREGAAKGLGQECLVAAMKDLKKRFRSLRTIVISIQPAQFVGRDEKVPPAILKANAQAIERLEDLFDAIEPEKYLNGEKRFTSTKYLTHQETLYALGAAEFGR